MGSERTYSLAHVEALTAHRKPGFVEAVKAMGRWRDGKVTLTSAERAEIRRRFMPTGLRGFQFHPDAGNPPKVAMPTDGPGGMLHKLIEACGFKPGAQCGCAKFAQQMNEWGWFGCLTTHRQEIVDWLVAQAKKNGVELKSASVMGLVGAIFTAVDTTAPSRRET